MAYFNWVLYRVCALPGTGWYTYQVAKYSVIGFPRALIGDLQWVEDGGNKSYGTLLRCGF